MICAHCDHDMDQHFDRIPGYGERCAQCVMEIMRGDHPYSDYVDRDGDTSEQYRDAIRWACQDFDH